MHWAPLPQVSVKPVHTKNTSRRAVWGSSGLRGPRPQLGLCLQGTEKEERGLITKI